MPACGVNAQRTKQDPSPAVSREDVLQLAYKGFPKD